jgi:hypothetical protein
MIDGEEDARPWAPDTRAIRRLDAGAGTMALVDRYLLWLHRGARIVDPGHRGSARRIATPTNAASPPRAERRYSVAGFLISIPI